MSNFLDSLGIVAQPKWMNGQDLRCKVSVEPTISKNGTKQFKFTFEATDSGATIDVYSAVTANSVGIVTARLRPLIGLSEDQKITLADVEKIHGADLSGLSAMVNVRTRMERNGEYLQTTVEVYEPVGSTTKAVSAAKELNETKAENASSVPF